MPAKPLSATERRVMRVCWDLGGEPAARDVHTRFQALFSGVRDYKTIATLLDRCVAKGYLARSTERGVGLYRPLVSREEVGREELARLLAELGPEDSLVTALREQLEAVAAESPAPPAAPLPRR